jgi:hypothetical protein
MPEITNFDVYKGTAPRLRWTLTKPDDVSGWTCAFSVYSSVGNIYNSWPVNIVDPVKGVFDVQITADTWVPMTAKTYAWTLMRTNVGFEDLLAYGNMTLKAV